MINLPASTFVGQRIPKSAFFANLHLNPWQRRALSAQLDSIHWRNKLAADTLHISPGRDVLELQVFELRLAEGVETCTLLDALDQQLPYHLLFLLLKGDLVKASIACKQANQGGANAFTVQERFETDWMALDALRLPLVGLNMDAVYEGWVQAIAGARLPVRPGEGMAQALERMKKRQALEKRIAALEKKAWSEKQPKKRFEMVQEIQRLRKKE